MQLFSVWWFTQSGAQLAAAPGYAADAQTARRQHWWAIPKGFKNGRVPSESVRSVGRHVESDELGICECFCFHNQVYLKKLIVC